MSDEHTDHGELRELIGAYVLDALSEREHALVQAHVRTCAECAAELQSLGVVAEGLGRGVAEHQPPPELRQRVLAAALADTSTRNRAEAPWPAPIRPRPSPALGWLLAAASIAAIVGGIYALTLRQRVAMLETQLAHASASASAAERQAADAGDAARATQQAMEILAAPDVARVDLAGQPPSPGSSGRAFWSRSRGLVFTAANLPPLPPGKVYQLWVVPQGNPIGMGLITPDASGRATVINGAVNLPPALAIAVTLEPAGGVPAPTGDKYLVGTL
jgi:anti-sigma-K factor RskA